jgi:transcriptional regulator with XRE-family HTH domain
MTGQFTNLDGGDISLPTSSLDLSKRMRELRARQELKQSEVARRMALDPSIPSLWEQGRRLVPPSRVRSLADALEVTVEELLDGVSGLSRAAKPVIESTARSGSDVSKERGLRARAATGPLLRLLPKQPNESEPQPMTEPEPERWVVPAERPPLVGWVPDGWQPSERLQDITPALPDGYWLDVVRLEKPSLRALLRSRLCPEDQALIGGREVPGAALAQRIYSHCSKEEGFLHVGARLPLIEAIFRAVLAAEYGGLTDAALAHTLRDLSGVQVTSMLLRRLRDSVRPYPMRRVDRDLFQSARGQDQDRVRLPRQRSPRTTDWCS